MKRNTPDINTDIITINDILIISETKSKVIISDGINEYTLLREDVIDIDEDSITLQECIARKWGLI